MTTYTSTYELPKPEASEAPNGPAQIGALADRLEVVLAGFDSNVTIGASNGNTTSTTIPDGNTWTSVEDPVYVEADTPGLLLVVGSVALKHNISSGDPQARIDISGPVSQDVENIGWVGTGTTGGIQVQATVPVISKATVTAAGTVTLQRQVRHHISTGEDHEYQNFDLYWVFIGQAG